MHVSDVQAGMSLAYQQELTFAFLPKTLKHEGEAVDDAKARFSL